MSDAVDVEPLTNIGERLRLAREAKKYSVDDVVTHLRLPKETILSLEEQRWDNLPSKAYVRGYFSNYIKFLGLPEEEMLALFNAEYKGKEPEINSQIGQEEDFSYQYKRKIPVQVFILLFVIIAIIIVGWFSYKHWRQSIAPIVDVSHQLEQSQVQTIQSNFSSVIEPSMNDESPRKQSELQLLETEEVSQAMESVLVQQTIPIETVMDVETSPIATKQIATLELKFSEDCWVDVNDATGDILLSKMVKANQTVVLTGKAPLTVLLGKGSVVTVKFNGDRMDISPYIRGNVARFNVGEAS